MGEGADRARRCAGEQILQPKMPGKFEAR